MTVNTRPDPDRELTDIAHYITGYKVRDPQALEQSRLRLFDTFACALDALDYPECSRLLGPAVPGTSVPNGARVPGTRYELDPATAAFSFGCMIRWLDMNDTFTAAQGSHPSDNLAGILMLADHLSRSALARGARPLTMHSVLEGFVKAYEIQGCLAIENDFKQMGIDHPLLTRVASTAVLTGMLGGTLEQVINAVSNAFIDVSLAVMRHAPNTGWRKSWAAADASQNAVRLAYMAVKGEMGYPSVLTAKHYGFYDTHCGGKPFKFQRPYGEYVIRHSMYKFVAAGMHGQSAVECAFRLHPLVKDRIQDIERIELHSQDALMRIMNKSGPLHNPADRDHCVQYIVAVGLIFGQLTARDFEDGTASDPRIDALRARMTIREDERYTRDFLDPQKRSSANAVQVFFKDGSSTAKVEVEFPPGHPRRGAEVLPMLEAKLKQSLGRRYADDRCERIMRLRDDAKRLDELPVNEFVDLWVA
jgi:2-methylcitrate dehydratase